MDTANFEPTIPSPLTPDQKKAFFVFTDPATDKFPPHLNLAANKHANTDESKVQRSTLSTADLFNKLRLAQLTTLLPTVIPKCFIEQVGAKVGQAAAWTAYGGMGRPDQGTTLADVETYNNQQSQKFWYQKDIFDLPNIGYVLNDLCYRAKHPSRKLVANSTIVSSDEGHSQARYLPTFSNQVS